MISAKNLIKCLLFQIFDVILQPVFKFQYNK